jgi:dimethylhistidine N-methyltransferase
MNVGVGAFINHTRAQLHHSLMATRPNFKIYNRLQDNAADERQKLVEGLRATPAHIEPKYFYDELGCALYAAICQLDEYYPTRTERAIFQAHRAAIAEAVAVTGAGSGGATGGGTFIDLGAGDCCKAVSWLPFIAPQRYLAVDIAAPSLATALEKMADDFPEVEMFGLATDFSTSLSIDDELMVGRRLVFYPGSSIGNFAPPDAVRFLQDIRRVIGHSGGSLLIGVDAKKDAAMLDAAYADALGVTAAFNLNALRNINRILGADFNCADWRHAGFYNAALGRVEMHLEAIRDITVRLEGVDRLFTKGERIHSENSYKYHRAEFEVLLREAGFAEIKCWTDADSAFWVFCAS